MILEFLSKIDPADWFAALIAFLGLVAIIQTARASYWKGHSRDHWLTADAENGTADYWRGRAEEMEDHIKSLQDEIGHLRNEPTVETNLIR